MPGLEAHDSSVVEIILKVTADWLLPYSGMAFFKSLLFKSYKGKRRSICRSSFLFFNTQESLIKQGAFGRAKCINSDDFEVNLMIARARSKRVNLKPATGCPTSLEIW